MAALTTEVPVNQVGEYAAEIQCGVDGAASKIWESALVCTLVASGYAVKAGTASTGPVEGVAKHTVDNSAGSDGDLSIDLLQGLFWRPNAGTVTQAHFGHIVYAGNDQDITATKSTNPIAGICLGVHSSQGVLTLIHAGINRGLQALSDLSSIANGFGSSLLGVEDAAGNFTGANVEAVLAEIMTLFAGVTGSTGANLLGYDDSGSKTSAATTADALDEIYVDTLSSKCTIDIPFDGSWYEVDGTALAAFADGASNTPGLALDNSEAAGIRWNNAANPDPICKTIPVPYDLDESVDVVATVVASKSGATVGDATTFDIGAFNNVVGALSDADADYGGTSSAMTGDATAKTIQGVTLTLALANLPNPDSAASAITVTIQPTDGTIGTDDVTTHFLRLTYTRKLRAS
jgi:hypothetical protein